MYENLIKELVKIIPRCVIIIERNSMGDSVIDHLLHSPIQSRLYYDKNKDLLDELLNTGVEVATEEEITIAGALVYSGPELLFKASDGTVLLRLNVNNSSFMGNADSATYFKANNDKYNLYTNL